MSISKSFAFIATILVAAAGLTGCKSTCPAGQVGAGEGGACIPVAASCDPSSSESMAHKCEADHRECQQVGNAAHCGSCVADYVSPAGVCRPVVKCAALDCAAKGQACVEADALHDAACGDCVAGKMKTAAGCVAPSCTPGAPGSLAASCEQAQRACVDDAGGARCGDCFAGFVENAQRTCVAVVTCAGLNCLNMNRMCEAEAAHADAHCGDCRAGFVEAGGVCQAVANATCDPAPATGSIADACTGQHRTCTSASNGATCGGCLSGFVEDTSTGKCLMLQDCATANCSALNRECSSTPTGHCTTCSAGFVEDSKTGRCRAVLTCNDIKCGIGDGGVMDQCSPPRVDVATGISTDAVCHSACPEGTTLWNGRRCEPCPPCNKASEDGPETVPTSGGYCICKTKPGYFYSLGGDIGTYACDADDDGWVRESARSAMTSLDPVLHQNARCNVRQVARFQLFGESAAQPVEVALQDPVPLYETDRNDDDQLLSGHWAVNNLVSYTGKTRAMSAAELNRLTKICHDPKNDYNDNGVPDVAEYGEQALSPTLLSEQRVFNRFSYFVELDWGAYLLSAAGATVNITQGSTAVTGTGFSRSWEGQFLTDGTNVLGKVDLVADAQHLTLASGAGASFSGAPSLQNFRDGTYVIHERSRAVAAATGRPAEAVAIDYGPKHDVYWRSCARHQDAEWNVPRPGADHTVGVELTGLRKPTGELVVSGMNHHSQFKCMVIGDTDPLHPEVQSWDALKTEGDILNVCSGGDKVVESGNASGTTVRCNPTYDPAATGVSPPQVGTVVWAAVPYQRYDLDFNQTSFTAVSQAPPAANYVRGCINECEVQYPACETAANVKKLPVTPPTIAGNAQAAGCEADPLAYGKFKRCTSVEVCDGVDNDGNGAVDENFPDKNQPCDTGKFGRCQPGTWICKNAGTATAVKFCQQNVGPIAEVCNGLDDDCNGAADDKIAQVGTTCTVTDPTACGGKPCLGACRTGTYGCDAAHGTPFCTPSAPKAEDCVNGNDLNCNGIVYDAPAGVACGGSFANFLPDQDSDGYPQANSQAQCLCVDTSRRPGGNSPANVSWSRYTIAQSAGKRSDYCDICQDGSTAGAATVYPRLQPEDANAYWSISANCCGNWDWDSDGASTQRFTSVGSDSCHWTNFSCPGISTTGWVQNSIPGCGQQAPYIGGGCHYVSGSGCYPDQTTGTQQCR